MGTAPLFATISVGLDQQILIRGHHPPCDPFVLHMHVQVVAQTKADLNLDFLLRNGGMINEHTFDTWPARNGVGAPTCENSHLRIITNYDNNR